MKATHKGDFDSYVHGIPCQIEVTYFAKGRAAQTYGPPERCYPEEYPECDFNVLDRKGYPAPWLEKKMTDDDVERITGEAVEQQTTRWEE